MTRKRKNVEETSVDPSEYPVETYSKKNEYEEGIFPKKKREERTFPTKGRQEDEDRNSNADEFSEQAVFPTDLVNYLRIVVADIDNGEVIDNEIYDKVIEECKGSEALLLSFFDSCKVVEKLFGHHAYGATLFLKAVFHLKHKKLLDMFFTSSSARTIEKLILAISFSNYEQINILSTIAELLCDNWYDAVTTPSSAILFRTVIKICAEAAKKSSTTNSSSQSVNQDLMQMFNRIADLAVDSSKQELLENPHYSLVLHDILDCDIMIGGKKSTQFVNKWLSSAETNIIDSFCGKGSSRVWDKAVCGCSEKSKAKLWERLKSHIERLALDPMANHPLQNLIKSTNSEKMQRDVCENLIRTLSKLLEGRRMGVIVAMLKCSKTLPDVQKAIMDVLQSYFRSDQGDFLFNVLTMNRFDGKNFEPSEADLQGSFLLQTLFELQDCKMLSARVADFSGELVRKMALNKPCAMVLQSILKSEAVETKTKEDLINAFEADWETLIAHHIGSHTFDIMWDLPLMTIAKKQALMKHFSGITNTSKQWKFAMLRCDLYLFRKDRKAWTNKMKNIQKH